MNIEQTTKQCEIDAKEALSDQPYLLRLSDVRIPNLLHDLRQRCPRLTLLRNESLVLLLSFIGSEEDEHRFGDQALLLDAFVESVNNTIDAMLRAVREKINADQCVEFDQSLGNRCIESMILPRDDIVLKCASDLLAQFDGAASKDAVQVVTLTARHFGALSNIRATLL